MIINLPTIKRNALLVLEIVWKILVIIVNWAFILMIGILSSPIWLPIVVWKTGLLISDNMMKHLIDD